MGVSNVTAPDPSSLPAEDGPSHLPDDYRAGLVGTGFMGRVHAHAIRATGGRIIGVAGSSPEKAQEALRPFGAERAFADASQLINNDLVNVVHICTPNHLHGPLAIEALAAGKHVVCEKPLATDTTTALQMTEAAEGAARVATVPFVYRFHPMAREARELVHSGGLGRLTLAHGGYLQDWLLRAADDNWRVDARRGGPLRAFGDIGSHWCDMLEFVSGDRITHLSARTSTVNDTRGDGSGGPVTTEDLLTLQFTTGGGMLGTAVISQVSAGRKNQLRLEISGTEASLSFDQEQPESLWVGGQERNLILMRDPQTLSPPAARLAHVPSGHPQGYQDCFNAFVADTRSAISGTTPDGLPVFADGLRAARIAEAVLASAREGTWVEVGQ